MKTLLWFDLDYFCHMQFLEKFQEVFISYLKQKQIVKSPITLYEPIDYILKLGGKRLRPLLTLIATDAFEADYKKALDAALAIEVFHNFTLVHDDIMDDAPLRRGHQTVHEKWDVNTGILSGDAMLIMAYQLFENYEPNIFKSLLTTFNKTALDVCEGQQYDIDFENRNDVSIPDYLKMIELKTSVLVAAALKMGAIVAKASIDDQNTIYEFGRNLGIAFQIQDDYLDAFGDPERFGKQVGGDIIENKKTLLYLKALEMANEAEQEQLQQLYSESTTNSANKVEVVKAIFEHSGAADAVKQEIERYTIRAFNHLDALTIANHKKEALKQFGQWLMTRTS